MLNLVQDVKSRYYLSTFIFLCLVAFLWYPVENFQVFSIGTFANDDGECSGVLSSEVIK